MGSKRTTVAITGDQQSIRLDELRWLVAQADGLPGETQVKVSVELERLELRTVTLTLTREADELPLALSLSGPHSRACGINRHKHGPACHRNCPTCKGQPIILTSTTH